MSTPTNVVCIECGQYVGGEAELNQHLATQHPPPVSPPVVAPASTPPSSSSNNNSSPLLDVINQLFRPNNPAADLSSTLLNPVLTASLLANPLLAQQQAQVQQLLANAALLELLRKQQEQLIQATVATAAAAAATSSNVSTAALNLSLSAAATSNLVATSHRLDDKMNQSPKSLHLPETPDSAKSGADTASTPTTPMEGSAKAEEEVDEDSVQELTVPKSNNKPLSVQKTGTQSSTNANRKYVCEYCGKNFAQAPTLIAHRRIHTGEKPYKCHICNAAFKQVTHRNDHVNSHDANYRPFVCEECGRGFARKYSLSIHALIHKGIYRFECSFCDKKFRQSADKKKHELRHTRVKTK